MEIKTKYALAQELWAISLEKQLTKVTIREVAATCKDGDVNVKYRGEDYSSYAEDELFETKDDAIAYFLGEYA